MVTISDSTIRQNVYETLYDALTALSYTGTSASVTVTAAYIESDEKIPQVVIHPVEVGYDQFSYDRGASDKRIDVLIDIWTKKAKDKDIIADAIMALLSTTNYAGMSFVGSTENENPDPVGNLKLHLKTITVTYLRR